jgi:acetolactate synthase-1/2/3 large subunit
MFSELESDLREAKKPLFLIGGGAGTVKAIPYPCVVTWNALDKVTPDQGHYAGVVGTYGGPGRNFAVQACDLLVAVGCRISGRITGGMVDNFAPRAKKWIIDIDEGTLKLANFDRKWKIDADKFWEEMEFALLTAEQVQWAIKTIEWVNKYDPVKPEMMEEFHHYGFMRKISEYIPDNAIITFDTGGNAIMMGHCFKPKKGQRIFSSNGNSPMGFSMCGAMGAWFADKTRPIVCFIGDGGFNMNLQELQTIKNYGINVKIFILNNHCYGNTKLFQRYNYGSRFYACGPDGYSPPSFYKIAKAYGIKCHKIPITPGWNQDVINKALHSDEAYIVDVEHHDFYEYLPRISRFDQDLCDQDPPLPREEVEANLA